MPIEPLHPDDPVQTRSPLYICTMMDSHGADLTARARIVGSAFDCFAELGFAAATIRGIAARAGVSPALITHHFGGKENLRAECDDRVMAFVQDKQAESADPAAVLEVAMTRYGPYLATMLDGPTDAAAALFQRLRAVARQANQQGVSSGQMRGSTDPDAQATALVVLAVAPFVLRRRVAEWAGEDGLRRLAVPLAEIYTHGLLTTDGVLNTAAAATGGRE